MLPGFAFFDFFKGRGRSSYQVKDELLNHPLKDKYFHRLIPYRKLDNRYIVAYDNNHPRVITFDDWPQTIFLAANGTKTIYQFTLEMAKAYNGRVPDGLERTIIEETEKLVAEKIMAISETKVILPKELLAPMEKNTKTMILTLGFSPCPNDTFIFDALIHHKIDTEGLDFEVSYDDVETLNQKAFVGELDITKLSYHAFAYVADHYVLLDSGSAVGFGVGPMLICKGDPEKLHAQLTTDNSQLKIGIPGKYTTANFLLGLAFPEAKNKVELVFSDIENAVLDGRVDIGLIIHENRFTYQDKGLKKIIDLGDYWEKQTGCAIPLGGIVVNRELPLDVQLKINRVLRRSVEFAFQNPKSGLEYIRSHAQEMSEEVMYKHIDLYVNKYSVELGDEGRKAIKLLFDTATEKHVIPKIEGNIFLT